MEYKQVLRLDQSTGQWIVYSIRRTPNGSVYAVKLGPWDGRPLTLKADMPKAA